MEKGTSVLAMREGMVIVGVVLMICMASVWVALYEVRGSGGGGGKDCCRAG